MVSTYAQPDHTSQTGSQYKTALDNATAVHHRIAGPFAPREKTGATSEMQVILDPGAVFDGADLVEVGEQSSGAIAVPTTNPRIDRIVIDRATGSLSRIEGSEAASPVPPTVPPGKLPVARVSLITGMVDITNGDITDERTLWPLGSVAVTDQSNIFVGDQQIFQSNDADGTAGPTLDIYRNSASPAASDEIGQIEFSAENSADGKEPYASISSQIDDPTATSEDGRISLTTRRGGANAIRLVLADGLQVGTPVGGDKGAGTLNVESACYENDILLSFTGEVRIYAGATAPSGWLLLEGGTMGNVASGGTARANADTEGLFTLLWNSMADADAPVLPAGRGASAAADFAANKTITLPDMRGRSPIGTGQGTGLTNRAHGSTGGAETHQLTESELASHTHDITGSSSSSSGLRIGMFRVNTARVNTTTSTGGDQPHNNMQPWLAMRFIIRL